jgi:hypothetical protein
MLRKVNSNKMMIEMNKIDLTIKINHTMVVVVVIEIIMEEVDNSNINKEVEEEVEDIEMTIKEKRKIEMNFILLVIH